MDLRPFLYKKQRNENKTLQDVTSQKGTPRRIKKQNIMRFF